jgi:hypothetical protein
MNCQLQRCLFTGTGMEKRKFIHYVIINESSTFGYR